MMPMNWLLWARLLRGISWFCPISVDQELMRCLARRRRPKRRSKRRRRSVVGDHRCLASSPGMCGRGRWMEKESRKLRSRKLGFPRFLHGKNSNIHIFIYFYLIIFLVLMYLLLLNFLWFLETNVFDLIHQEFIPFGDASFSLYLPLSLSLNQVKI